MIKYENDFIPIKPRKKHAIGSAKQHTIVAFPILRSGNVNYSYIIYKQSKGELQ
jgi:hypothetical protein